MRLVTASYNAQKWPILPSLRRNWTNFLCLLIFSSLPRAKSTSCTFRASSIPRASELDEEDEKDEEDEDEATVGAGEEEDSASSLKEIVTINLRGPGGNITVQESWCSLLQNKRLGPCLVNSSISLDINSSLSFELTKHVQHLVPL